MEDRYKDDCYQRQNSYALETRDNDFAEVFDLCAAVEKEFRPSCYQGLGWDARLNRVFGAMNYFIRDRYGDAKARSFCGSLGADLRTACLRETKEYSASLSPR